MATEEIYQDDLFVINLTIDGTEFEEVEVEVTDPTLSIREQITRIVSVFKLPKIDNGGTPVEYLLGQIMDEGDEPNILEFEDAEGRENTLLDFNVQSGDSLRLFLPPPLRFLLLLCRFVCCDNFKNIVHKTEKIK